MNFKCDKCPYKTRYSHSLRRHERWIHCDLQPFSCSFPGCAFRTKSKAQVAVHKRIHETKLELRKPFLCSFPNCNYRASQHSCLKVHQRRKHAPNTTKAVQCPLCPARFYSKKYLNTHIRHHVKEQRFKCAQCQFVTHSQSSLKRHLKILHEKSKRFKCSMDGCTYTTAYHFVLNQHVKVHNPDPLIRRPFSCTVPDCCYRLSTASHLKRHIFLHHTPNRSKKFSCTLCSQKFYEASGLKHHIKVRHTNEKHSCKICNFATHELSSLKSHCSRVHGLGEAPEKKFKCESCDYRSTQRHALEVHKRTKHSEIRECHCSSPGCSYSTNYPPGFQKHLLIHEKDPLKQFPFNCTILECDYRSRTITEMRKHERSHAISKIRLKCKLCQMDQFPDKHSLRFHEYLNHGKSYQCSFCSYYGISKRALSLHLRTRHNPEKSHQMSINTENWPQGRRNINVEAISARQVCKGTQGCLLRSSVCHRLPVVLLEKINVKIL